MAAALLSAASASAQIPVALDPPPDAAQAVRQIYGGPTWRDAKVNAFFGGSARQPLQAHVHEVFRQRFVESGIDKLMLVYQLTPGPRSLFQCGACVPALGAAVLAADERGRWQVRARGLLLMAGTPGSGAEDVSLVQLDEDRWMLRSRRLDNDRGRESRHERLVIERGGELVLAVELGFEAKPGPQLCGSGAAPQSSGVSVLSPGRGPRVEIVLRFNEGSCPSPKPIVQRTRFELHEGRFNLEPSVEREP